MGARGFLTKGNEVNEGVRAELRDGGLAYSPEFSGSAGVEKGSRGGRGSAFALRDSRLHLLTAWRDGVTRGGGGKDEG